jgi:hypothetical protein
VARELGRIEDLALGPASALGPQVMAEALIASAGGTKEGLAKRIATYLLRIARGKGLGDAKVTASEQMRAMDLIWRMSGGSEDAKNLGPEGRQADAQVALAEVAKKLWRERRERKLGSGSNGAAVEANGTVLR